MTNEALKLCVVEESELDRGLFQAMMQSKKRPWLRDVACDYFARHIRKPEHYLHFDGVVMTYSNESCMVAKLIHTLDSHLPVALLMHSGADQAPSDIYDYAWQIATKPCTGANRRSTDDVLGVMRAFLRTCAAVKLGRVAN